MKAIVQQENSQAPSHIETEISDPSVMSLHPIVSVLMMAYNHEEYIAEAIEGVIMQQTDFPIELLIGEDSSTDNTREIVLDYQQRFPGLIRLVYSDRNLGAWHNSNRLYAKIRGEFVADCEGDDYWCDPLKLQKQVDFLRSNPDYGMVHSDYHGLVDVFGAWRLIQARYRPKRKVIPQGDIFEPLLNAMLVRTCTRMARADLLRKHNESRLRSSSYLVGDRPTVLHMSKLGKIGYINEPMAVYRRASGSMVNSGYSSLVRMQQNLLDILHDFLDEFGEQNIDIQAIRTNYYRTLASFAFRAEMQSEFYEAVDWLDAHAPEVGRSNHVKLMKFLMKNRWMLKPAATLRHAFRELDLFLRAFRPE